MNIKPITNRQKAFNYIKLYNLLECKETLGSGSLSKMYYEKESFQKFFLMEIEKEPIGWCCFWSNEFHIFIRPEFRRMGYGTKLIEKVNKHITSRNGICPWDMRSKSFFSNFNLPISRRFM